MSRAVLWGFVSLVVASSAAAGPPAGVQNVKAARGAAERALVKERFCEAVFLFQKVDEVEPNPDWIVQAADAAQFADDRAQALALFKKALSRAPKHNRARAMEKSIEALTALVAKSGPGTPCTAPRPECGNGVIEGTESCDDGNTASGDQCPANCTGGVAHAPPPPPPPTPPPPVVVGIPAPKVPIIVPPPPVVVAPPVVVPPPPAPPPPPAQPPPKSVITPEDEDLLTGETTPSTPAPAASKAPPAGGDSCSTSKTLKIFVKGDWKSVPAGTLLTVKSRGELWTMVQGPMGDGKIASGSFEGACAKAATPAAAATVDGEVEDRGDRSALLEAVSGGDTEDDDEEEETKVEEPKPAPPPPPRPPPPEEKKREYRGGEKFEEEPAAGLGSLPGWIMAGAGAALVVVGAATAGYGSLPYFEYMGLCEAPFGASDCPKLATFADEYKGEPDANDRAEIATDTEDLRKDVEDAAQKWDQGSVFVMGGGIAALGLGAVVMVGGVVFALVAGGSAPDEGGSLE